MRSVVLKQAGHIGISSLRQHDQLGFAGGALKEHLQRDHHLAVRVAADLLGIFPLGANRRQGAAQASKSVTLDQLLQRQHLVRAKWVQHCRTPSPGVKQLQPPHSNSSV